MSVEHLELSEFVKQTLTQIAEGISQASDAVEELGGKVNPRSHEGGGFYGARETKVEFDLVVGVESAVSGGGKAKISVLGQGISGGGEVAEKSHASNRVAFSVFAQFPETDPIPTKDIKSSGYL